MREKGSTWVEGPFSYLYPVWPPPTGQQGQSPAPQSAPLCPVTYVSLSPVSLLPSLSSFFAPSSSRPHACHVSISVPTQHRRSGLWIHLCFSFSHAMAHPLSLFLSWSISHSPHLYFSLFFMISLSFTLCVFLFSVSLSTAHQLHCYHWFSQGQCPFLTIFPFVSSSSSHPHLGRIKSWSYISLFLYQSVPYPFLWHRLEPFSLFTLNFIESLGTHLLSAHCVLNAIFTSWIHISEKVSYLQELEIIKIIIIKITNT